VSSTDVKTLKRKKNGFKEVFNKREKVKKR